ncbi:hypothetical protein FDECE_475 [Fusarium decemcellulare]|nr:hypothetical protein FDECE_475 [Fusarium decemcellulare]
MDHHHETVVTCDILIIGGGAAGLTGAAVAEGHKTILVEKAGKIGGRTTLSSGMIWMPSNTTSRPCRSFRRPRPVDGKDQGRMYIEKAVAASDPDGNGLLSAAAKKRTGAFLTKGPAMINFLHEKGFKWMRRRSRFPDYHPSLGGSRPTGGRALDPAVVDMAALGPFARYAPHENERPVASRFEDLRVLKRRLSSVQDFLAAGKILLRSSLYGIYLDHPVSMGRSLIVQLLSICRREQVDIYTDTELLELWYEDGVVLGGRLKRGRESFKVRALRGVLLATGGFDGHLGGSDVAFPLQPGADSHPDDSPGSTVALGRRIGARTCSVRELGGIPMMRDPRTGRRIPAMFEISLPFSILVNSQGHRFSAESKPPGLVAETMFAMSERCVTRDARAWLIVDQSYRRRYSLGSIRQWTAINRALDRGFLLQADTIGSLADKLGIARQTLEATVQQWNEACDGRSDVDHKRGNDDFQRFMGDPRVRPNPCLGPVKRAPFYATRITPVGDRPEERLLTDEHGRVLRPDDSIIPGLYAVGSASACVIRDTPLGAGAALASSMTFAYAAVQHMLLQEKGSATGLDLAEKDRRGEERT